MIPLSEYFENECYKAGFAGFTINKAEPLEGHLEYLQEWLSHGYHGKMGYLAKNTAIRYNPTLLMPEVKSIITVLLNYYPSQKMSIDDNYRIAKYAYGKDYHDIVKEKLNKIAQGAFEKYGDFNFRSFCDSAPIADRVWAQKGGLGWIGKNTLLINKDLGSFFFIGHLFIDRELPTWQSTQPDLCLDCDKCLKACPTQAFFAPYQMNASKCLSYQTIENKSDIKDIEPKKFRNWIFGCDICQDVCPYNKISTPHIIEELNPHQSLFAMKKADWEQLTPEAFQQIFNKSAVKRAGYKGLTQNINWVKQK